MEALLIVDPLNDFADKKGSLYVKDGEQIIPIINDIMEDGDMRTNITLMPGDIITVPESNF